MPTLEVFITLLVLCFSHQHLDWDSASPLCCWSAGQVDPSTLRWSETSDWRSAPRWLYNIANGFAQGPAQARLVDTILLGFSPLASSHLEPIHELRWCVPFPWGRPAYFHITLSPSCTLHIPSGPLSSRSTELLFIVTGRTVQCITASPIPFTVRVLFMKGWHKCCCGAIKQAWGPIFYPVLFYLLIYISEVSFWIINLSKFHRFCFKTK